MIKDLYQFGGTVNCQPIKIESLPRREDRAEDQKDWHGNTSMAASSADDDRLKLLANCVSATLTVLSFGIIHGNQRPTRPQGRGFEPSLVLKLARGFQGG